jgi:AbrB family looped-hinge helix DNA binding protein
LNKFYSFFIILFMITEVTKLTNGNRVVIPAAIRKGLGLQVGDSVTLILDDNGGVRLLTQAEAVRQAQALVRHHVSKERSLVEELLAERREEAPGRE